MTKIALPQDVGQITFASSSGGGAAACRVRTAHMARPAPQGQAGMSVAQQLGHLLLEQARVLEYLRTAWCRRIVLALVLGSFLPVTSATVSCQISCAFELLDSIRSVRSGAHEAGQEQMTSHGGSHLMHAGPCHLGALPALASAAGCDAPVGTESAWDPAQLIAPPSLAWPPPEHRPKA